MLLRGALHQHGTRMGLETGSRDGRGTLAKDLKTGRAVRAANGGG